MSYLLEYETKNITEDILKRKEFYKYKIDHSVHNNNNNIYERNTHKHDKNIKIIPKFFINKMIRDGNHLQLSSYQNFVKNYINTNTPYSRLMIKWETGIGKTVAGLSIAMNFIQYYQRETLNDTPDIGSVFIIGFTSVQFKTELLRHPEFGIISRKELQKLLTLKTLAASGNKFDIENHQEFLMRIKKRFNNRENNGFFEFIGYKKLFNMIFLVNDSKTNITNMDEKEIYDAIQKNKIKLNTELLERFKNSIIICDEIHNTYNSLEKNNWGVAIQYILNHHPSIRAVFLSATPINNNPTEIVDLLNLLLPKTHFPEPLKKSDFFDNNKQLKIGAIDKIEKLSKGRFSYLRDINPKYFPTKTFIGETIKGASYLKFIRCPMSEFHYNTYKHAYTGSLSPESQYLVDFALPNPKNPKIGMYQTSVIKSELSYATQEWKNTNKINYKRDVIVGDILQAKNLPKISNKFAEMLKVVIKNIETQSGKMFIYHNIIHMSGVLFIKEIFLQNNIIGESDSSNSETLCAICGKAKKEHKKEQLDDLVGGSNLNMDPDGYMKSNLDDYKVSNLEIKYNPNTQSHTVYLDNMHVFEYRKYDNFMLIHMSLVNQNMSLNDIVNAIEQVCSNEKVVFESRSSNPILVTLINQMILRKLKKPDNTPDNVPSEMSYYTNVVEVELNDYTYINELIDQFHIKQKSGDYKRGGSKGDHMYAPARFIVVHGMVDKKKLYNSIDKYNLPDNHDGNRILILIGGKIIKEAFDIKAVREMMIMGRPDNIPTLIQILGRSIRKGSHNSVSSDKRNVNIRIFTSCLPIKKNGVYLTSYEEDKYIEKLQHYKIIQEIEKIIHQNAIDAFINKDIIWTDTDRQFYKKNKTHKELGSLYFEPNVSGKIVNKQFTLNELNLNTFNAYHTDAEVSDIILLIKRLFIEKSTIWTYKDLLYAIRNCNKYFNVEFNTRLVDEELFIVALTRLLYMVNSKYSEPLIKYNEDQVNNMLDKMFDPDDKIIILPGNQKSIISQVGKYYILFPIDKTTNSPIKDMELTYRISKEASPNEINIKQFLEKGKSISDYSNKRDRFYTKWNNTPIEKLELAVCDFGIDFHIQFLEECIEYIFNVWTNYKVKKSLMHSFYFKMLNYYNLRNLVIWGDIVKEFMYKRYTKYLNPVRSKLGKNKMNLNEIQTKDKGIYTSGLINFLNSSIVSSNVNWISTGLRKQFKGNVAKSLELFDGKYKKSSTKDKKVDANLVPLGHFLNHIPKFYHPDTGWIEVPEYLEFNETFKENSVIVGYDERSNTGVHIRFKIRSPIQNIKQFKDSRLIEKGSVCNTKNKIYLKSIADKLDIKIKGKINVESLCVSIRTKLIYLEIKERVAKTNKKWFYFIYEHRPETILYEKNK